MEGPPGSGKSVLVEHIAELTGNAEGGCPWLSTSRKVALRDVAVRAAAGADCKHELPGGQQGRGKWVLCCTEHVAHGIRQGPLSCLLASH